MSRLKQYAAILPAFLAAAVLAFASLSNFFDREYADWLKSAPSGALALKDFSIALVAIVIAILANTFSFLAIRKTLNAKSDVDLMEGKIRSIFFEGIDYILLNEKESIYEFVNNIKIERSISPSDHYYYLFVFTEIDGLYQITASTNQQTAVQNRMRFKSGEGLVGKVYNEKTEIILNYQTNEITSYNGVRIGQQEELSVSNQIKGASGICWIVSRPIFDSSKTNPNSDLVYGIVSVDTNDPQGNMIFFDPRFSEFLGQLSDSISPFLVAYRSLKTSPGPA
jgi:hypothetical protein